MYNADCASLYCREESRTHGFCVILDGNIMSDFLQTKMMKALNKFQVYCSFRESGK